METIKGIYAEAKIFTDDAEDYAKAQVKMICDNEVAKESTICMMPDIHPGKIAPIGLSMTVTDKIIPQLLGVDIGCGMTCVKLNKDHAEFQKLDKIIRENIPAGFAIRKEPHHMASDFKKEMKGIYSSCVGTETLDEAPAAYRSITEIAEQIKDTVEITQIAKPVYNFKAGSRK